MSELVAACALSFAAAYLLLHNQAASVNPKPPQQTALHSTEQVLTTNVRGRMGDAIGTGAAIGLTRAQMGHTQQASEADIHVSHTLQPTRPPVLNIGCSTLCHTPAGAPPQATAWPVQLDDARYNSERMAEAELRAERARILYCNGQRTYSAAPRGTLNLEAMGDELNRAPVLTRTIDQSTPLIDTLPSEALSHDASVRMAQMSSVSAEPGDSVKVAALSVM